MGVEYITFSNGLRAKDLCYSDDFFKLKGKKIIPSDSFSFSSYNALKDVNDFKTNNYSNLFLIKKQKNTDWLKANIKKGDDILDLSSYIKIGNQYIYFPKNYDFDFGEPDDILDLNLIEKEYNGVDTNYIFYINFISDSECTIAHTFGDLVYYLDYKKDENDKFVVCFNKQTSDNKLICNYNKEQSEIVLYKQIDDELYTLKVSNKKLYFVKSSDVTDDSNLCNLSKHIIDFDFYMDDTWIRYDRSQYISSIDYDNSYFGIDSQALIHHEYNKDDGFNFIPLKNTLSYKGNTIRGSYSGGSSDVEFRNYTNIHTGVVSEKANDNIILSFSFNEQEYEVNDGEDLIFTIDYEGLSENGLELSNTKFIENGSFGSEVPYFSDKVKKLDFKQDDKLGTYLCSWLYKKDIDDTKLVWKDRYYYPRLLGKNSQSVSELYSMPVSDGDVYKNTYYDKDSSLKIENGKTYKYHRLSTEMVDEVIEKNSQFAIDDIIDNKKKNVKISDYFIFDNEHYRVIKPEKWNKTNVINFNTDIYLERNKRMGIQLFGSDYKEGFNIQNRKDLAPFHYYATDETLYLCNNSFEAVHQFNIYEKFNDKILRLFLGDIFDDVIVVTGIRMYILTYDLMLKSRIDLTSDENEKFAIKGLDELDIELEKILDISEAIFDGEDLTGRYENNEIPSVSLINYPYANTSIELQSDDTINYTNKTPIYFDSSVGGTIDMGEKIISLCKIQYDDNVYQGSVNIYSRVSETLCKYNGVLYNNNLYIPFKQDILKIVMCPDVEKDDESFTEKDREEYPAIIRKLNNDEFYCNFIPNETSESVSTEQGMIEVENIIKNIYIDEEGNIYGVNYDQFAIAGDGDTMYGLYGRDKYINSGGWWWIFNQSLSKMKSNASSSKYAEFSSNNSIDRIKFNELGEMGLIRNFSNLIENENEDNNKRFDIYDKSKKIIYTYDLSHHEQIISFDAYNYIDEKMNEQTCFSVLCKSYGYLTEIKYLSNDKKVQVKSVSLPANACENFIETTNTNAIARYRDYNSLYFNLNYNSNYLYNRKATIKWNLDDIQNGWYNINVYINLDEAIFEVRINDKLYKSYKDKYFEPYVSSNGTVFATTYYIGTLGKKYGLTLNTILKNGIYDPYVCKDSKIENMSIYNKKLSLHEYQAMRLKGKKINQLILTLPCGRRNCIEEIVRYFKYNSSPSISNKVKITISGTGLKSEGEFDLLRKEITSALENNKDCLVTVKDIQFI